MHHNSYDFQHLHQVLNAEVVVSSAHLSECGTQYLLRRLIDTAHRLQLNSDGLQQMLGLFIGHGHAPVFPNAPDRRAHANEVGIIDNTQRQVLPVVLPVGILVDFGDFVAVLAQTLNELFKNLLFCHFFFDEVGILRHVVAFA